MSGVVGIAYNPFLDSEAGGAHRNHEVAELLKFWTEKIIETDTVERERQSLGLILEKTPEVISVPRSSKRVELKMGNGNGMLVTNLVEIAKTLLVPTSPRKPDRGGHEASEVSTDRRRRPSNIEYSAQADLASGEGVRRGNE